MERIREDEDSYNYEEDTDEDINNMENLRNNFSKEELVRMCSEFARSNMNLVHWLYKYHLGILRDYENKHMNGHHISFLD